MRKLSIIIAVFVMFMLSNVFTVVHAGTELERIDKVCREKWEMSGAKTLANVTYTTNEIGYTKANKYLYYHNKGLNENYDFEIIQKLGKHLVFYCSGVTTHYGRTKTTEFNSNYRQLVAIDVTRSTEEDRFYLDKAQNGSSLFYLTGGKHYKLVNLLKVEINGFDSKIPVVACVSNGRDRSMWKIKYKK